MKQIVFHEKVGTIVYEESFWTGKKSITINDMPLQKISKKVFQAVTGETVNVNGNFLSGVSIEIGGEKIQVTPAVKWYEIVMSIFPLVLVFTWGNSQELCKIIPIVGGAIGGLIGAAFTALNIITVKGVKNIFLKILISIGFFALTFAVCAGIGYAIVSAVS